MTKEQAIKSFKKYIIFQESTLNDYYKIDEEFYKDKIEQLELSTTLLKTVLSMLEEQDKIIDLTIKELYKKAHISTRCYLQTSVNACMKHKNCYECLKQYFENKVKQKSEQK